MSKSRSFVDIWKSIDLAVYAVGIFACYIPLTMMVKMASKGLFAVQNGAGLTSFEIFPLYALGNTMATIAFLTLAGWWRYAKHTKILGISIPHPRWFTFFSGVCIIGQIFTAIWAYTFDGISLVFATLLMKGGVLIVAPMVDLASRGKKRRIYWPSWVAALLSLIAIIAASVDKADTMITLICAIDIAFYLTSYLIRLSIMSKYAKNDAQDERKAYVTEDQITVSLVFMLAILAMGLIGYGAGGSGPCAEVWRGFTVVPRSGFIISPLIMGMAAAGAGMFASLVYLDRRENTFCVTASKAASILASTVSTTLLFIFYGQSSPGTGKFLGVALIMVAIIFMVYRGAVEKKARLKTVSAEETI